MHLCMFFVVIQKIIIMTADQQNDFIIVANKLEEYKLTYTARKKKEKKNSHAGNRTPATAVRAPDPNH